ncbi:MAG: DinB family protein [Chloroflexota bacterium]|nr:DinB family protein [Chloroflexota bacterium]
MQDLLRAVRAVLVTTPPRCQRLTAALPIDVLTRSPAPGEWSAVACLQHVLDTERLAFPQRVQALLAGQDVAAFDPDAEGPRLSPDVRPIDLAAAFSDARTASLKLLASVTAADLYRTARQSELGIVTVGELLHEWAAHDLMHTVQAERALMQPFIAGVVHGVPTSRIMTSARGRGSSGATGRDMALWSATPSASIAMLVELRADAARTHDEASRSGYGTGGGVSCSASERDCLPRPRLQPRHPRRASRRRHRCGEMRVPTYRYQDLPR